MTVATQLKQKIANKTKPPGSLGRLEELAIQAGLIQNTLTPRILKPHIVVFAGDHGIAAKGKVNPYPQSVTAQMVLNFVAGGAAINVFCKQFAISLTVVDAGVNASFPRSLPIVHAKMGMGTADYSEGSAMSYETAVAAVYRGASIVQQIYATGSNTIGFGEMGIGNSSSAALLMHYYTGLPIESCTGRGTGSNDEQLQQKINLLTATAQLHQLSEKIYSPYELLSKVGGFELAMMAGAYLKAYQLGMLLVVDGFIATAALLVAIDLQKEKVLTTKDTSLLRNCVFAHCSAESGHASILQYLGVHPLLQLDMRLGEGTGSALAIPVLQTAVAVLNEMAEFDKLETLS
jgi:nicotinate-nucleotide--dimethylbenzimidazole phosphoribosyltransferase